MPNGQQMLLCLFRQNGPASESWISLLVIHKFPRGVEEVRHFSKLYVTRGETIEKGGDWKALQKHIELGYHGVFGHKHTSDYYVIVNPAKISQHVESEVALFKDLPDTSIVAIDDVILGELLIYLGRNGIKNARLG